MVKDILSKQAKGVLVLDLTAPGLAGRDLLKRVREECPEIPIIILTGSNDLDTAVQCMKEGAVDYLVKPVEDSRLASSIRRAIENAEFQEQYLLLPAPAKPQPQAFPEAVSAIVTQNETMVAIFRYLEAVAKTPRPVLITGETGVGKDLVAQAIHHLSERPGRFIAINAAGLDDNLFSDTLFGHRKGAFTGAGVQQRGLIEQATGGTLFLDEIGDLSPVSQIKLLRLIQEGEYYMLGSNEPSRSNARIVVATNCDLSQLQDANQFRRDLYYRLATHRVSIPALRERMEDLPLLLNHFLRKSCENLGKTVPAAPPELLTLLSTYHFPGNVRELESMVFDAVCNHRAGVLSLATFREYIGKANDGAEHVPQNTGTHMAASASSWPVLPTLRAASQILIEEALERSKGNQRVAASLLGISAPSLNRRLKRAKN